MNPCCIIQPYVQSVPQRIQQCFLCAMAVAFVVCMVGHHAAAQTYTPTASSPLATATVLAYFSSLHVQQPASFRRVLPKSDVFTIPFRNLGKLIRVQATVNGKKGYFSRP